MKKIIVILLVVCMAMFAVLAQGGSETAKGTKQITIGFSSKDNSDVFVKNISDAAKVEAKRLGVKLLMSDARGDVNTQISDVENFIAQKVDAVIVIPQSVEGSAPVVSMCNEAKIPIVVCNGDIADTNYTAFVGCTDQESGEILGKWMCDNLPAGSNICIIEGPMGQSGQVGRYAGFKAVGMLDKFNVLSVQTANWKRDEAMALAEDWLTTYGSKLNAIVCENDDMGMGALSACLAAGRSDVIVGGVDAITDAVQAVKAGTYKISVLQDASGQGGGSIDVAVRIVKGEQYKKDTRIPFVGITAENVDAYLAGGVSAITK
ncbi:substrate-binding domain-containing protein [Treponema parvum]|uniref:Substrate-binding domain-containing protein n=2 Tax=Treponema parvum TaxID=138851 RepID=A0A975IB54_9SPIR|nr:substrate-binding domain-containing protein [Treponema parvum]QTQ10756.1 substrate-binding domain-containing protein [Treponema parvum]